MPLIDNMMTYRRIFSALALCLLLSTSASAQTDDQSFEMQVPVVLSIAAPQDTVSLSHDETDTNQAFPAQTWDVSGNPGAGVTVTFAVATPFELTGNTSLKADCLLSVSVRSETGADFEPVAPGSAQTNYASNIDTATVSATSDGPGSAELDLAVTFISPVFSDLAAGTYTTTVTGTIASN